jgi:hypothetical protein
VPLFTYLVVYKGAVHVAQGSHSNFTGFASTWAANIPASALPSLTPTLQKDLQRIAYQGAFSLTPGTKHAWQSGFLSEDMSSLFTSYKRSDRATIPLPITAPEGEPS